MSLPTCQCNAGLPVQQQLANIYCALVAIQSGSSGAVTLDQLIALGVINYGFIQDYAGDPAHTAPPTGWLYCDGQSISRATYANLFAVIGLTYGAVDAAHFNLPDLQGRVRAGFAPTTDRLDIGGTDPGGFGGNNVGDAGGEAAHTLTDAEVPANVLIQSSNTDAASGGDVPIDQSGGGSAHNNIQPTMILNAIIFAGV